MTEPCGRLDSGECMDKEFEALVNIGGKPVVPREATAEGFIRLQPATLDAIREGLVTKGDVIQASTVAVIQAVKDTPRIVPHCHPIPLTGCDVDWNVEDDGLRCLVRVRAEWRTGVEMEALTGVSAGLLCAWDMVKSLEKDDSGQYPNAVIEQVRVLEKRKGEPQD